MNERIKELRKRCNLTLKEFSERIGMSLTGLSEIERGANAVQERHIRLILAAFPEVSEQWLRAGTGEMMRPKSPAIASILNQYSFPDIIGKMLEAYEQLPDEQQQTILDYARDVVARIAAIPDDMASIDAKVEAYRAELLAEKNMGMSDHSQRTEKDA